MEHVRGIVNLAMLDYKEHAKRGARPGGGVQLTQQHPKEEVDINTIVERFGLTGQMPFGVTGGFYGDFTGIEDYESALGLVEGAQERFRALPPHVREAFHNDPGELIQYVRGATKEQYEALYNKAPTEASSSAASPQAE